MYIVSFKFVQALLLFKIAGEGSQGKENARKLDIRICLITNSRCSDFWPELTSHHFLSLVDWGDSELCCVLL